QPPHPNILYHSSPTRRSSDLQNLRKNTAAVAKPMAMAPPRKSSIISGVLVPDETEQQYRNRRKREPQPDGAKIDGREYEHVENEDRKSTRLNSSHVKISYAVF